MRTAVVAVTVLLGVAAGCTSTDGEDAAPAPTQSEQVADVDDGEQFSDDMSLDDIVVRLEEPAVVDGVAEQSCVRYGYTCSMLDATDEQLEAGESALDRVAAAIDGEPDAREQLRLALIESSKVPGLTVVGLDVDSATMLSFSVDGGPRYSVLTRAGLLQDGEAASGETAGSDADARPSSSAEPEGLARPRGLTAVLPERYEPAGGPANEQRRALIVNPFDWSSAFDIANIFQREEQYSTVDVVSGAAVTPFALDSVGSYDAVHIITHGGGQCPPWTNDRAECSSTFVGGELDGEYFQQERADADASVALDFWFCGVGDATHYCFESNAFPSNPNGITYFGSCGSDFGFNTSGAGASVGWTGTTQRFVAERSAAEFWTYMVTDGVEFRLAEQLIKSSATDSHTSTFWASGGDVNQFTESVFAGRNLRARDVIEVNIDGSEPEGQIVQLSGTPEDGADEKFPAKGQPIVFVIEGVKSGTEGAVQFEVKGDDKVWESDIDLVRDGTMKESADGYATWQVTLAEGSVKVPDIEYADLSFDAPPLKLEVRAFEQASEYTAALGEIRFGTDLAALGSVQVYRQLLDAFGSDADADLRVAFNSAGGPLMGNMKVQASARGVVFGEWTLDLDGEYDAESGTLTGVGTATGLAGVNVPGASGLPGVPGASSSDAGGGPFTGTVDLDAQRVLIEFGGAPDQNWVGEFVG